MMGVRAPLADFCSHPIILVWFFYDSFIKKYNDINIGCFKRKKQNR